MANTSNRWALEQGILDQVFSDRDKLLELRTDPRATLERALGQAIPAQVEVKVAFDKPRKFHQVVPDPSHTLLGAIEPPTGDAAIPGMRGLAVATAHRAASDPEFRAQLISDAKGFAAAGLSKLALPEKLEIKVLEEDPSTIWLTVPIVDRPRPGAGRGRPEQPPRGRR